MMPAPSDPQCQGFYDDLAAAATGTSTGRRRAEVLDHLEHCPACAAELDRLSSAVDALMILVPDADPPAGFADRTIALMGAGAGAGDRTAVAGAGTRGRAAGAGGAAGAEPADARIAPVQHLRARRRAARPVLAAAAAAVVALALGVGIGDLVASSGGAGVGGGSAATSGIRTADLRSATGAQGSVVVAPGRPGWLVMTVDANARGMVTCQVTLADGSRRVVARYPMASGYGSWAVRLPVPASSVRSVQVVDDKGVTLAWARLPAAASS